jgi:hypothetical protein
MRSCGGRHTRGLAIAGAGNDLAVEAPLHGLVAGSDGHQPQMAVVCQRWVQQKGGEKQRAHAATRANVVP